MVKVVVVAGVVVIVVDVVDPLTEHSDSNEGVTPLNGNPGQPVLPDM